MRGFLAVDPDDELCRAIAAVQQDLKNAAGLATSKRTRITWVQPHAIHLTLKFLGDIDESLIGPIQTTLTAAGPLHRAIDLPLVRVGAFPRTQEPRVLWLGPPEEWERGADAMRLSALQRTVEHACAMLGVPRDEQRWRPHLTLGRVRAGEREIGRAFAESGILERPVASAPLAVREIALIKSDLRPDGPVHTRLWSVTLGAV